MQHYHHHKLGDDPLPLLALFAPKYHKLLHLHQNPVVYSTAALNDWTGFMSFFLKEQHSDIWYQTPVQSSVHLKGTFEIVASS